MTNFLNDSIPTQPPPIARDIIPTQWTRLVTMNEKNRKYFAVIPVSPYKTYLVRTRHELSNKGKDFDLTGAFRQFVVVGISNLLCFDLT
jgi:hypothetical protein